MSLNIVDKSVVENPCMCISKINSTIDGWDKYTSFIARTYIKRDGAILFDFAKPSTATDYSGYVIVKQDPEKSEAAYLSYIAIDKSAHKQGMGSQLLESTVEKVKKFAYKKLTLHCREPNLGFYEKFAKKNLYSLSSELLPNNPRLPGKRYFLTLDLTKEKTDEKGKELSSSSSSSSSTVSELFS